MGWLQKLSEGLSKTRTTVTSQLDRWLGKNPDPALLADLESALIGADLGVHVVEKFMDHVKNEVRGAEAATDNNVKGALRRTVLDVLWPVQTQSILELVEKGPKPFVILIVGVNGVGKTTTVAKLAQRLAGQGCRPLLVAADTFRAAAIEQLQVWAERIGVEVIRHRPGADPAAVVYDGMTAARSRGADVLLIDTAGRLHTKVNLMEELRKIKRVLGQDGSGAPHEVLLILDASVGQNALFQARQFHEAVGVTGLVVTKLDGTARGGIVVAIADELRIPVRLIGVGEAAEDLQDFNAEAFVDALF
ncbi:MAG: signal recognition particle-docking protein FtsY [Nitrospiraceae bacterium]|jgi:fused signal recognition particle receptor